VSDDSEEETQTTQGDSWRNQVGGNSSDDESESGDDSDEGPSKAKTNADRQRNDMNALLRQQTRAQRPIPSKEQVAEPQKEAVPEKETNEPRAQEREREREQEKEQEREPDDEPSSSPTSASAKKGSFSPSARESQEDLSVGTPRTTPSGSGKKKSFVSRLLFGSSSNVDSPVAGKSVSLLSQDISKVDDAWFQRWTNRLGKDGLLCTKVATNGKPYDRRFHVDARNLAVEVRGGRNGASAILMDDLVDVLQGLSSPEFGKFCQRFKKELEMSELVKRAIVLQTPARTFSFLFASESQRDTIAQYIVVLLKSKNRGVMADNGGVKSTVSQKPPREGAGKVTYPNCSSYEGQFHNFCRHGEGCLTLSDGTRYECEWRNDERHGQGKEYWADGTIFSGSYLKGMRNGHGVMTWPEGSRYSGQFERGRANGDGELVRTDGSIYRGHFSEDCMSGDGRMVWRDGVEYVGQFVANRREGKGRMVWTSGRWKSYDGEWKEGVQHGHGTLVDQNNGEFSGHFINGKLDRWDDDI